MVCQQSDSSPHTLKPSYGLYEFPEYWWQTVKQWNAQDHEMDQIVLEPCLFYRKNSNNFTLVLAAIADNTLDVSNTQFSLAESDNSKSFDFKPRDSEIEQKFGGLLLYKCDFLITVEQGEYAESLGSIEQILSL